MDENPEPGSRDPPQIDDLFSSAEQERPLSPDKLLSALANEHRRAILTALVNAPQKTLEHDTLIAHVADRVQDEDAERVSDEHQQRIQIALHHTHLPKLEEAQIIDYKTETGNVQFSGGELEQKILTLVE